MQTSSSPAPVEVFWNSSDFSQLLSWAALVFRQLRPVKVHTSSESLLIWSPDSKVVLISLCKSSDVGASSGPVLATLYISRFKARFPLLFEEKSEQLPLLKVPA